MRLLTCLVLAFSFVPLMAFAQQKPATESAPFVVEQTYWIKPGKELQFIELFEKNRVPMLRARVKEGHILWMRLSKPQFNAVNEQISVRMEQLFAGKGYDYTYLYPGLQKVVQAAGRVIRTPQDEGVVHLIDDRFARTEVRRLLPDWWAVHQGPPG